MPPTLMHHFLRMYFHGNSWKETHSLHRPTSCAKDETFGFSRYPRNRRASSLRDARHTKRPSSYWATRLTGGDE